MQTEVFTTIIITMMFSFIATAIVTHRTLDRRFSHPVMAACWILAFAVATWLCYQEIDHIFGISDEPIFSLSLQAMQITSVLCIFTFSAVWVVTTMAAYRGTASSKALTALLLNTVCLTSYIGIQIMTTILDNGVHVHIGSLKDTFAIYASVTALVFIPIASVLPGVMKRMIIRTEGRMERYVLVTILVYILFSLDFYLLIYDNHNSVMDLYRSLATTALCALSLYLLLTNLNRSISVSRYHKELDEGSALQASLLPDESVMSCVPGIAMHASVIPAKEVAGDFYDVVPLQDGRAAVIVADVSDKGVPAAMFSMRAKTVLDECARFGLDAGECLERANASLMAGNASCMFVTVLLAIVSAGRMDIACAGHPSPVLIRDGEATEMGVPRGPMLGLMEGRYRTASFDLQEGDTVLMYTDGATDAEDRDRRMFGIERLMEAASEGGEDVCDRIMRSLDSFSRGVDRADDTTLLSLTAIQTDDRTSS